MPGLLAQWPAWREFRYDKTVDEANKNDPDYRATKETIIKEYGQAAIEQSWLTACAGLERVVEDITVRGRDVIPVITMEDVEAGHVSLEKQDEMRKVGCFIVRNVVPSEEADALFKDLRRFTKANQGRFSAWPVDCPSICNLYNTPTQNALRSHPQQVRLMRWINQLWHWSADNAEVSADPLIYADAVRIRPGGSAFLGLGPHIDAGSLCRWADPGYRKVYEAVFSGNPDQFDGYDLEAREAANQVLFAGTAHSTVLRGFQGWTALTRTAPREGTILLYPNLKAVIPYILLRPFFRPPEDPCQILDAKQWQFDHEGTWFPGTFKPDSQYLSDVSHPHLRLKECLLHVPELQAGDTVWWHTDVSTNCCVIELLRNSC